MRLELMVERGAGGSSLGNRAKRVRNLVSTDRAIARRASFKAFQKSARRC
jgi:hypothetical protein